MTLRSKLTWPSLSWMALGVGFDARRYLAANPDVAAEVERGAFSAWEHYRRHGFWEDRPFPAHGDGWRRRAAALLHRLDDAMQGVELTVHRGVVPVNGSAIPFGTRLLRAEDASAEVSIPVRAEPGCYMVTVWVESNLRASYTRLVFEDAAGKVVGSAGLAQRAGKAVRRLVWIEGGAACRVRIAPLSDGGLFHFRTFRLRRVGDDFARSRLLARLAHHTGEFAGWPPNAILLELEQRARREGAEDLDAAVWRLARACYEATFPARGAPGDYGSWLRTHEAAHDLELDVKAEAVAATLGARPLISVLIPVYETDEAHLRHCLDSVLAQSYPKWEVCAVDDGSKSAHVRRILKDYRAQDPRIRIAFRDSNGHIARAANDALAMARGELVALLDHDDELPRHALLQMVLAFERRPSAVLAYGDEDKLGLVGRHSPHFKPDFDPDRLLEQCYIGHLAVARTDRVREVGGFREGFEGSQDHDLWLRLTEGVDPADVVHVPWVTYHWRESPGSTAQRGDAKPYAAVAGLSAVQDALHRRKAAAVAWHHDRIPNAYRVDWQLPEPAPLVSVIVPTRDAVHLLETCVVELLRRTRYPRFELLLIDNESEKPETFAFFARLLRDDTRVRVLHYRGAFNFAAINNFAVAQARGDVLALVNNDVEPVEPTWLEQMVAHAVRPEIGCVGAKLLYPDDTLQHAGVILGIGGVAGHAHKRLPCEQLGYFGRPHLTHTVSAVTAACLVVKKQHYERAGGMDAESLPVAFNDVDLCLKVRALGQRNLFVPAAVLRHHESASRGADTTGPNLERFGREIACMKQRWQAALLDDPFYNRQLSLTTEDFRLRSS